MKSVIASEWKASTQFRRSVAAAGVYSLSISILATHKANRSTKEVRIEVLATR